MPDPEVVARYLLKSINQAVRDFDLITDDDRIAVGISGGKDSRTLLDMLHRGVNIPGSYEITAVHIDGTNAGLPSMRSTLEPWFQQMGISYDFSPLEISPEEPLPMSCFRCSWNRRKALFLAAERLKCNKVAFGHHADDAAVTTLMSLLYKGQLESLAPSLEFFDGHFTVIRPLIYLSAAEISQYARACGWSFSKAQECPQNDSSRRVQIERFLEAFSDKEQAQFRANLWRIAQPEKVV
jgi:tRNA(Ile)-lysidine synthase TilS/MesJ